MSAIREISYKTNNHGYFSVKLQVSKDTEYSTERQRKQRQEE